MDNGAGRFILGVMLKYEFTFPFDVKISLDKVGGPSAGMMFALGIIDTVTPGDLTGGKHIAGTGTITPDGVVGPIGGIGQKMYGARAGRGHGVPGPGRQLRGSGGAHSGRAAGGQSGEPRRGAGRRRTWSVQAATHPAFPRAPATRLIAGTKLYRHSWQK